MTGKEARWAFDNGVMVKLEIDPIQKKDTWYECILELVFVKKNGMTAVYAVCKDRIANSVTRAPISEIEFAKREDEERCHREITIQSTAVS